MKLEFEERVWSLLEGLRGISRSKRPPQAPHVQIYFTFETTPPTAEHNNRSSSQLHDDETFNFYAAGKKLGSSRRQEGDIKLGEMATETWTMTLSERQRKPNDPNLPPENERSLRACSDIVSFLVQDHEAQQDPSTPRKDVNLNSLRAKMSKKHRLSNMPPLTAIIAAIPEHYKKYILPKLIAKPIRKYLPLLQY